jgi:hypothetical protein
MRPVRYAWDNAMVEGRRRLALLEHSLDPSTFRRLEWDRELAELDDPKRLFVSPMTLAVIATKP